MNKSLSTDDIRKITGENNPILTYSQLQDYDSISDIFNKLNSDNFILLYETSLNFGHWCCCFKLPNGDIEFYDPYGGKPDDRLKHMKDYYTQVLRGQGRYYYPHLSKLLLNAPENVKIHFSPYRHQKFEVGINTCGRHVGNRLLHRFMDIDEYTRVFGKKNLDKDITVFTNNFLK